MAADVRFLSLEQKVVIKGSSPVPIRDRLSELEAFQGWMDWARTVRKHSRYLTRAQVLSQNYFCFVYLPEAASVRSAKFVRTVQQPGNARGSSVTIRYEPLGTRSLTRIGGIARTSRRSSSGLEKGVIPMSHANVSRLSRMS